jgi:hypothetical protein
MADSEKKLLALFLQLVAKETALNKISSKDSLAECESLMEKLCFLITSVEAQFHGYAKYETLLF